MTLSPALTTLRGLYRRLVTTAAIDPTDREPAAIKARLDQLMAEVLGWPDKRRRPVPPGLPGPAALAYSLSDDGEASLLVQAVSLGEAPMLDLATAKGAGIRWLVVSDLGFVQIHDLEQGGMLSMDARQDGGMGVILDALRFGSDVEGRLEHLSQVQKVQALGADFLVHHLVERREALMDELLTYGAARGVHADRAVAMPVLLDSPGFLDLAAAWAAGASPSDGTADSAEVAPPWPQEPAPASPVAPATVALVGSSPNATTAGAAGIAGGTPLPPIVLEQPLVALPTHQRPFKINARAVQLPNGDFVYELLAGSGAVAVSKKGGPRQTSGAVPSTLESAQVRLVTPNVAPGDMRKSSHLPYYVVGRTIAFDTLGRLIEAAFGTVMAAADIFVDPKTRQPMSVGAIKAAIKAAKAAGEAATLPSFTLKLVA